MKFVIFVGIILFFSYAISEESGHLQFQCQPQLGCGIFDQCTRKALDKLRAELEDLMTEKFEKAMNNSSMSLAKFKKDASLSRAKDIQEVKNEMSILMDDKMEEVQNQWVDALQGTTEDLEKKNKIALGKSEKAFQERISDSEEKMTLVLSNANKDIKSSFDKAMNQFRNATKKSITTKIRESEAKFATSLTDVKLEVERSIKKVTDDLRAEMNNRFSSIVKESEKKLRESVTKLERRMDGVRKKSEKEVSSLQLKLISANNNISGVEKKCEESFKTLDKKLTKTIESVPKENITMMGITEMVDNKIEAALKDWNASLTKEVRQNITTTALSKKGLCNLPYDGKCFWAIEPDLASTFLFSKYECEEKGGTVANIYSKDHYDMIVNYLRSLITRGRSYIDVWLGMTIDPETGFVSHQDGSSAFFTHWEPGSPAIGSVFDQWTNIYLIVRGSKTSSYQGMVNSSPEDIRDAVLCEI